MELSPSKDFLVTSRHRFDPGFKADEQQSTGPYKYAVYKGYAQNPNPCLKTYGANVDNYTSLKFPKIHPAIVDTETQLSNRCVSSKEGGSKFVNLCHPKTALPFHVCNNTENMQVNTRANAPATQNRVHGMDRVYALQKDPQIAQIEQPCWVRYPENTKYTTQMELLPEHRKESKPKISFQAEKYKKPNIYIPEIKSQYKK